MAKQMNAQNWANNWSQNLSTAGQAYTQGVQGVPTAPGQTAAQNVQKYLSGVTQAVNDGSYVNGCNSVSLQSWQNSAVQKGAPRLASGAQAAKSKVQSYAQAAIPVMQQLQQQISQMPSNNAQDGAARATAWILGMAAQKGKLKQ